MPSNSIILWRLGKICISRLCNTRMATFNAENTTNPARREEAQSAALFGESGSIPQLRDIRRVRARYCDMLPLSIMKQYRCAVIGAARGVLTVAVTTPYHPQLVELLARFTGYVIFPVCVQPARMDLLLRRVERWQLARRRGKWRLFQQAPAPIHSVGTLLAYRDRQSR